MPRLMNNRAKYVRPVTVDDVVDNETFYQFAHQRLGVAMPLARERPAVAKKINEFLEAWPDATVRALTDVVTWARVRRKHFTMLQLITSWKYAHQDGFMKILERGSTNDAETLNALLRSVDDPYVQKRMIMASSAAVRDRIFDEYLHSSGGGADYKEESSELGFGLVEGQVVKVQLSLASGTEQFGSVLGTDGGKILVLIGTDQYELGPHLVQVRDGNDWVRL